jgi:hypothetical protein
MTRAHGHPLIALRVDAYARRGMRTSGLYLRLLDADAQDADWRDVARTVLHLDPEHESDRALRAYESHLSRAKCGMVTGTCT